MHDQQRKKERKGGREGKKNSVETISSWESVEEKSRWKRYIGWAWSTAYFRVFLEGKPEEAERDKWTSRAVPTFPS